MAPQYQVYSLPGTDPDKQVFTVSDGFVPASQANLSNANQNFNLTAFMVGLADPHQYGELDLYEVPQGTAGPANADAEISANKTVSSDITLLDQHGSEVLLGETLMVPIGNSMVYLRPLYASPTTNPQPQLQYVIGVLGKNVQIDTSLGNVLSDLLNTTVTLPSGSGVPSTGTVPAAVAGILQQAQTDYTNALAALKAQQLGQFQSDLQAMQAAIAQAQDVLSATTGATTTTTTTSTTTPAVKGGKSTKKAGTTTTTAATRGASSSSTTTSVPTSTEPKNTTSTTSPAPVSAAPKT
jgi:uncharacterized protein